MFPKHPAQHAGKPTGGWGACRRCCAPWSSRRWRSLRSACAPACPRAPPCWRLPTPRAARTPAARCRGARPQPRPRKALKEASATCLCVSSRAVAGPAAAVRAGCKFFAGAGAHFDLSPNSPQDFWLDSVISSTRSDCRGELPPAADGAREPEDEQRDAVALRPHLLAPGPARRGARPQPLRACSGAALW